MLAAAMNGAERSGSEEDGHEHDLVMPGFRFHPTEEELVEFYLRGKVEGRRFTVDLIAYLDLYCYDPWELPAFATIGGEKEWFFFVPRGRKYRNGDRPNRVTTSGYWKATGADRMVRGEITARPIGLKKTLVFYTGKAPKGVRTPWIMNEYRLPHTDSYSLISHHKADISLCRVYKRAGVEDRYRPPAGDDALLCEGRSSCTDLQPAMDPPSYSLEKYSGNPARGRPPMISSAQVLMAMPLLPREAYGAVRAASLAPTPPPWNTTTRWDGGAPLPPEARAHVVDDCRPPSTAASSSYGRVPAAPVFGEPCHQDYVPVDTNEHFSLQPPGAAGVPRSLAAVRDRSWDHHWKTIPEAQTSVVYQLF